MPIEELADALDDAYTAELRLAHWRQYGDKLDAYILRNGHFTIGVRYGDEPSEYLSVYAHDRSKIEALLKKYDNPQSVRDAAENLLIAIGMGWDIDGCAENLRTALERCGSTKRVKLND